LFVPIWAAIQTTSISRCTAITGSWRSSANIQPYSGTLSLRRALHVVDVTGDYKLFRQVTDVVHEVAEALKKTLPTERVYLMSLGSHQGNAHVHWHVAPLPPGVPYERQ